MAHLLQPLSQHTSARCGLLSCASTEFAHVCTLTSIMHWSWIGIGNLPIQITSCPEGLQHVCSMTTYGSVPQLLPDVTCVVAHDGTHCKCPDTEVLLHTVCCCTLVTSPANAHSKCCTYFRVLGMSWKELMQSSKSTHSHTAAGFPKGVCKTSFLVVSTEFCLKQVLYADRSFAKQAC